MTEIETFPSDPPAASSQPFTPSLPPLGLLLSIFLSNYLHNSSLHLFGPPPTVASLISNFPDVEVVFPKNINKFEAKFVDILSDLRYIILSDAKFLSFFLLRHDVSEATNYFKQQNFKLKS